MLEGVEQGRLSVERQGLFTVFEGHCKGQEGLLRLSVYGGGKEGYLGLMQPRSGGLYLKKKLSKAQLSEFPEKIEYAAEAGKGVEAAAAEPPVNELCGSSKAEELVWFRRSDGSLVSHDGKSCIVALPAKLREAAPQAVIRRIDGQSYMLFRY